MRKRITPLVLLMLAGCTTVSREDFAEVCQAEADSRLTLPFYQPGGRGYHERDIIHHNARVQCEHRHVQNFTRKRTNQVAPVVNLLLGAGSDAMAQSYPQFRRRCFYC